MVCPRSLGAYSTANPYGPLEIPSIQPVYAIPTEKNGSNHTPAFAESAKTPEAHAASIRTSKALAATGLRVLTDDDFWSRVRLLLALLRVVVCSFLCTCPQIASSRTLSKSP